MSKEDYSFLAQLQSSMMRNPWTALYEWEVIVCTSHVDKATGQALGPGSFRRVVNVVAQSEEEAQMLGKDLCVRGEWARSEEAQYTSVYAQRGKKITGESK